MKNLNVLQLTHFYYLTLKTTKVMRTIVSIIFTLFSLIACYVAITATSTEEFVVSSIVLFGSTILFVINHEVTKSY